MYKLLTILVLLVTLNVANSKVFSIRIGFGNQYITPNYLEVYIGDTIRFINYGSFNTTTSTSVPINAKNWDIDLRSFKGYFEMKFDVEGFYEFHSETHPQNKGIIFVKGHPAVKTKPYVSQNTKQEMFDFYMGNNLSGDIDLRVYDILGKVLVEKKVYVSNGYGQFDAKSINKGIYFLKLYHDYKQVFFYKFLKE